MFIMHTFFQQTKLNRDIPMFQAHGNIDPLVSPVFGELTSKFLKTTSSKHTYKTYPMMHSSCEEVSGYCLNPFMTAGLTHYYLGGSTFIFSDIRTDFEFISFFDENRLAQDHALCPVVLYLQLYC